MEASKKKGKEEAAGEEWVSDEEVEENVVKVEHQSRSKAKASSTPVEEKEEEEEEEEEGGDQMGDHEEDLEAVDEIQKIESKAEKEQEQRQQQVKPFAKASFFSFVRFRTLVLGCPSVCPSVNNSCPFGHVLS